MNRIAIIGASGELGCRLVDYLRPSHAVVAIVRDPRKRDFSACPGLELRQVADVSDVEGLSQALAGCNAIINAGYIWFAPHIHQAVKRGASTIEHVVFTGSTGIHTSLPSPSAERKRSAEKFIEDEFDCPWTIIRPTMIYGHRNDRNISRLVQTLARFPILPLIGQGNSLIQPVLIHDLVRAYGTALLDARFYNKRYDIGGSKAYSNRELIACAASSIGRRTRLIPLPAALVHGAVALLSMLGVSPITREQIRRFQEDKSINLDAFVEDFHYVPCDFERGIRFLLSDLKEHGMLPS